MDSCICTWSTLTHTPVSVFQWFPTGISWCSNILPACVPVTKLLKMANKNAEVFKKWLGIVESCNKMLKIAENCYILQNIGKSSQIFAKIAKLCWKLPDLNPKEENNADHLVYAD